MCLVQIAQKAGPVILLDIWAFERPAFTAGGLKTLRAGPGAETALRWRFEWFTFLHGVAMVNVFDVQEV